MSLIEERSKRLQNLSPAQRERLLQLVRERESQKGEAEGIRPHAGPGPWPLSFAQQRLWFLDRLAPGSAAYNIPYALHLEGNLDVAPLARALSEVARRHSVLRARFVEREGQAVQEISPPTPLALPLVDLGGLSEAAAGDETSRLTSEQARRPFDLASGPLLRNLLVRRSAQDHLLSVTLHHIVSDGWSMANFAREVTVLYAAFIDGLPPPFPALEVQYTDYAAWQRRRLTGETLERHLAYWRRQIAGAPAVLELPADHPRPAIQSFRGKTLQIVLPPDLTAAVRRLAQESDTTLFTCLLAAFQLLLGRLSGQTDIVVGAPVANRTRPELEPLIGLFVNTLAMRSDLTENEPFRQLLGRVKATTLKAYDHQELPFEKLVDELDLPRTLSYNPLIQVLFALQNMPAGGRGAQEGLRVTPVTADSGTSQLDLNLSLVEAGGGLSGGMQYSTDLFEAATLRRMAGSFAALLTGLAADPETRIWELPWLSPAERCQAILEWNDTGAMFSGGDTTLRDLLREQAARTPGALAVICSGSSLTYRELDSRALRLASRLRELGVGPESLVALCAERSLELMVALSGILYAGGAYLPLDPGYPVDRLTFMLESSGAAALLVQPHLAAALPPFAGPVLELTGEAGLLPSDLRAADLLPTLLPENLAYVIYTSGSTGRPKGVMNTHRGIVNRLLWMQQAYGLEAGERVLQKTPVSFDVSVWELFWPLLTGAAIVMARPGGHRESDYLVDLIAGERVTTLHFVPSMLRAFLEEPTLERLSGSVLRRVMASGEALTAELRDLFAERLGCELHNLYGPTEAAVDVTSWPCYGFSGDRAVPIGRPISNLRIHILDRHGELVAPGVPGELHIGGVGLARGYRARPDLTAGLFVPDAWGPDSGGRLYRTGDLARFRPDGVIEYLGRIDHQVKVRGFRIELGEIEAVLARHAGVREAAVLAREDGGTVRLVAYFVGHEDRCPEGGELAAFLGASLPDFMVPSFFVPLDVLPLSPNGKLDRRALPAPERGLSAALSGFTLPRTPVEEILCSIWEQVLGLERVGIHDNFFALGGDSILSLRALSLASSRGLKISLSDLFLHQTVAALAAGCGALPDGLAEPARSLTAPFDLVSPADRALLPDDVEDAYPLAMLQLGMLYHMEQTPEEPLYHNVDSWHVRGQLSVEVFREAVRRVVARHPMLRTSFHLTEFSEPLQLVHREAILPVTMEDIRLLSPEEQERWIDGLILREKRCQFDFTIAPQTRFHCAPRSADTFQFTLTENHAIFDGWSMHSTLAEIFELYLDLLAEREVAEKPPLELTYRDFIALEKQILASPEAEAFWVERLAGFTPTEIPRWPVRPEASGLRMRSAQIPVGTELYAGLKQLARQAAVPLKSVALAAHLKVVSLLAGSSDVITGVAANGRLEQGDGDQVRGLFLNTLPLRFELAEGTWRDLVHQTFAEERRLLPFRRYPMAALHRRSNDRELFEIAFNFIHFHVVEGLVSSGELEVLSARGSEGTNFKLLVHFEQDPGARALVLEIEYDSRQVPREQALAIGEIYLRVLREMAAHPESSHTVSPLLPPAEIHALIYEWNDSTAPALHFVDLFGPPLADTRVLVLDPAGQPLPRGSVGEIWVGGGALARDDPGGPDLTAERFVPDPFSHEPGACLYRTGDLGRWQIDGRLEHLGRADRQAKLRARREEKPVAVEAYAAPRSEKEEILTGIWKSLLRLERIGIHDNFFALGGDSILSLQFGSRARREGLRLTSRQILAHPTIAELAVLAEETAGITSTPWSAPAGATVPLTPIQQWFFARELPRSHHFNQALLLEVDSLAGPRPAQAGLLSHAFERLTDHHEALSHRFERAPDEPAGWRQLGRPAAPDPIRPAFVELAGLPLELRAAALGTVASALQESLDLTAGPLVRAALFDLGDDAPWRLLVIAHHLVIDGVSWRILLEDLEILCRQIERGEAPALPEAVPFRHWAERLAVHAGSTAVGEQAVYWLARSDRREACPPLPADHAGALSSARSVLISLGAEETRALLQDVPRAYRTQINDALLTALGQALFDWTGRPLHWIDLEGHGREDLGDDLDLSRTVGWLTSLYPVMIDLQGVTGPGAALRTVKEQLRAVPGRGLAYGLLRSLGSGEGAERLRTFPASDVLFNYLGQLDETVAPGRLFRPLRGGTGPLRDLRQPRSHLLEVEAAVHGGCLHVAFVYSSERQERATIDALAGTFAATLRELIAHASSTTAGGFTPSDFPLVTLDQRALDRLAEALPAELEDLYPASPVQQGMLFHTLEAARPGVYVNQLAVTLDTALDVAAFERAWAEVVARHAVLRTAFVWSGLDEPLQAVLRTAPIHWVREDWRGSGGEQQGGRLSAWLETDRRQGFDPATAPLLRCAMLRCDEQRYHFVWTFHHLLLDGWSIPILLRELFALYETGRLGTEARLEKPLPFRDYIAWLRAQDGDAAREYWQRTLSGVTEPTPLALDRSRAGSESAPVLTAAANLLLPADPTERLRTFARSLHLTMSTLSQAAWALLLARSADRDDVLFGMAASGRSAPLPGIESMVGIFINTLPVRVRVDASAPVAEWLEDLQHRQAEMLQYEHSSLAEVHGWSGVARSLPLFESLLVFENYPVDETVRERAGAALAISGVRAVEQTNYPLALLLSPGASFLGLQIVYDAHRFDEATVRRMLGHLATLLESLPAADGAIGEVELLSVGERRQILDGSVGERRDAPGSIPERFAAQVARTPREPALVWRDETLSYSEVAAQANRLAHHLREAGVGEESPVAILLEKSASAVVAILAVVAAGGSWVPLSPDHPADRLAFILEDTGAPVIVTESRWRHVLPALQAGVRVICLDEEAERIAAWPVSRPPVSVPARALAYTIYTSGSTGRPKGVQVEHCSAVHLLAALEALAPRLCGGPLRASLNAPLIFDASVQQIVLLLAGHTLCIVPEEVRTDPAALLGLLRRERVDLLDCTPSLLRALVGVGLLEEGPSVIFSAGEAIDEVLWEALAAARGQEIYNIYGPTECTVDATGHRIGSVPGGPTIGRPFANYEAYLLGGDLRPVLPGSPGELCLGGRGLARGYVGQPALTAERFVPHPFSALPGERLYRSGDQARHRPDGELEFIGRADQQVKIRGYRIEPGEIEAVLRLHPLVGDAAVAAVSRRAGSETTTVLTAWVQPVDGAAKTAELCAVLMRYLRERLPAYMIPAVIFPTSALPLTASGKIDRRALTAAAPESSRSRGRSTGTWTEALVADIFAEVLRAGSVGPEDGFFELGGHSLSATRLLSRLRTAFGIELPMRELFDHQTVAALAAEIDTRLAEGATGAAPPVKPAPRNGPLPLSFAQQRLWFLDQLNPGDPAYNVPVVLRVTGRLDERALEASLGEIVRRHEILRTVFREVDGEPVQQPLAPEPLVLPLIDLSELEPPLRDTERRRLAQAEAQNRFSLHGAFPRRLLLLRLADEERFLLITLHHILCDGWSMGVLVRELGALYAAFADGRPSSLPDLAIQYADFAAWQRGWLQGETLRQSSGWWMDRLAGAPLLLELPGALPRAVGSRRGGHRLRRLDASLTRDLEALGRRESSTLFMTLLAAFNTLLHAETGAIDLVVGTDVAQRDRAEIEPLVGFFVNQLALRTDLSGNPEFRDLLVRARETALGAYTHQELPFERLVELLNAPRSLGVSPVFQVKIALFNLPQESLDLPGIELSSVEPETPTAQVDLSLRILQVTGELVLSLEHDIGVYDASSMDRFLALFEETLRRVTAEPEVRLDSLVAGLRQADRSRRVERVGELQASRRESLQKLKSKTATSERP
jgi:amino acid adenylation domain-containing protein/non-ribosomal peptide synthase protein (TIGR01720 family)